MAEADAVTPGLPTLQRLCAELIVLRERNDRQHKLFEQALAQTRVDLRAGFSQFASDAQQAYQRLRDELTGEKRYSLALLATLLELTLDVQKVAEARPPLDQAASAWGETVAVAARKAEAALAQLGVHRYDAIVGSAYEPALHERVGSRTVEGIGPLRVAVQIEPGFASQQPDFVLRRAKILITE